MPIAERPKAPARRASAAKAVQVPVAGIREQGLQGIVQVAQLLLVMGNQYADAAATGIHGPGIARETAALADANETIAKGVDYLVTAGPYTGLIAAVLPFAMQIAANHGRLDASRAGMVGVIEPAVLEQQMRADIVARRNEAEQAARDAAEHERKMQAEADALQAEWDAENAGPHDQ